MGAWRRQPSWIVGIFILLLCYVHKKNLSLTSLTILDFVVFVSPSPLVLGNRLFPFLRTWSHEILTAFVSKANPGPGPGHELTRITFFPWLASQRGWPYQKCWPAFSLGFDVYRLFFKLFTICLWLCWVLVAVRAFLWLRGTGSSSWWLLLFRSAGPRRAGFSGCGTGPHVVHGEALTCAVVERKVAELCCDIARGCWSRLPHHVKKGTQNEGMKPRCEDTKLGNGAKPSRDEKREKFLINTLSHSSQDVNQWAAFYFCFSWFGLNFWPYN